MTSNLHRESATIYQFPVGGRTALNRRPADKTSTPLANERADISYGGSWYHDEAVREERNRKN